MSSTLVLHMCMYLLTHGTWWICFSKVAKYSTLAVAVAGPGCGLVVLCSLY